MSRDYITEIIREATRLNLSISEVCRRAGVPRRWIERAKNRNKTLDYIGRLFDVLEKAKNNDGDNSNTRDTRAD